MDDSKTVFVSGVGRGIGHDLAAELVVAGYRVFGSVRPGRPGDSAELDLVGVFEFDQADEQSVVAALGDASRTIGPLDVLINCAGADSRSFAPGPVQRSVFDLDSDGYAALLQTNVVGPLLVARELLGCLRAAAEMRGESLLMNISSQLGSMQIAATMGRDAPYCVSKAGTNMFSVKAALELKEDNIAVVAVHPGWVQTDMGGAEATMTTSESAAAIAQLVGQLAMADTGRFIRWDNTDHPW